MHNEDVTRFDQEGYALIRDVVDADIVDKLRRQFLADLAHQNSRLLVDSVVYYPELRDMLLRPRLFNALTSILGKPFVVLPPTSVDHNRFGQFHTDTSSAELAGWTFHKDPNFRCVVLGLYLQDNNEFGGGLRVVPGTHLVPDPYVAMLGNKRDLRARVDRSPIRRLLKKLSRGKLYSWREESLENVPRQIDIPTRVGDALIWDMRLVHRASPQQVTGTNLPGGKVAVFYTLGANNESSRKWIEYMIACGEMDRVRAKDTVFPPPTDNVIIL